MNIKVQSTLKQPQVAQSGPYVYLRNNYEQITLKDPIEGADQLLWAYDEIVIEGITKEEAEANFDYIWDHQDEYKIIQKNGSYDV